VPDIAEQIIVKAEDRVPYVYPDSRGFWTIGIGCLVDKRVQGSGLCDAAIEAQFAHDSAKARAFAAALPGYEGCNDVQRGVLVSMCFQLGSLEHWPDFRAALAKGDFVTAAEAGLDSQWAKQTQVRAKWEMTMLQSGTFTEYPV
jgi:lysozyme